MQGKTVLITGPTSGIGKVVAQQLGALGADLVLACRNVPLGERVAQEIRQRGGAQRISVLHVDTASAPSIRECARQFRQQHERLDVLINNAGINRRQRQTNDAGIELTFATNVLGYHLLTRELLPVLKASAPARVVNVASSYAGSLDLDDLQFERRPYDAARAYAQSKACDRMLTWALARRLDGSGVTANAMTPGLVQTGLYRDVPWSLRLRLRALGLVFGRSAAKGADSATWLASSADVSGVSAKFFELRRELPCQFRNNEAEEKLWSICEAMCDSA